jgi:hypothetical protein
LVQIDEKDHVVTETGKAMSGGHGYNEGKHIIDKRVECLQIKHNTDFIIIGICVVHEAILCHQHVTQGSSYQIKSTLLSFNRKFHSYLPRHPQTHPYFLAHSSVQTTAPKARLLDESKVYYKTKQDNKRNKNYLVHKGSPW